MSRRSPISSKHRVRVIALAVLIAGLCATALPSSAATTESSWTAQLMIRGDFGQLISADGNLYAIRYVPHGPLARGSQLVKINPNSGQILRVSRVVTGLSSLTFIDGMIWADGVEYYPKNSMSEGPATFVQIDPLTLAINRVIIQAGNGIDGLVPGPYDELWAYDSKLSGCTLQRINSTNGLRLPISLKLGPGQCGGEVIDSSNNDLYVAMNTQGLKMTIYRVNAATGVVVSRRQLQSIANFVQLIGVGNSLWVAGGDPGANGTLLYIDATSLQQIQGSRPIDQYLGATDQRAFQLPIFGEFPTLSLSGGTIWVGSAGQTACFRPSNWHVVSSNKKRMTFFSAGDFSVVGHVMWSNFQVNGNGLGGLGIVHSPPACM